MNRALIISDGKPGHFNQSIALCKHLDLEYDILEIAYRSKFHKAWSYVLDHLSVYTESLFTSAFQLKTSNFKLIISAGSTTYYANKLLAKKRNLPNIAILNPGGYRLNFSHIFCPAYNHPPKRKNITELPLNLCATDAEFFKEKADDFKTRHTQLKPSIGIIIGGSNAVSEIDPDQLKNELDRIFKLTDGMERWVTTSRRTPVDVEKMIDSMPFDYKLINSREDYNPIPAFLHLCDRLIVTSDSASMISECASYGSAKLEILMNRPLKTPNKFQELISGLERSNSAHRFDGTFGDCHQKIDIQKIIQQAMES